MKLYSPSENAHRDALRFLHGRRATGVRQATSMLAAVELVSALVRRTGNRALAVAASRQLETFSQTELTVRHRDYAVRLALSGIARGADTAIAAQVLLVAGASVASVEFLTADADQGRLVRREAKTRGLQLEVVELPV